MAKRGATFRIPPVKGRTPGPIPASTEYVPPSDPEEEAAYASTAGRSDEGRGRRRGREDAEALSGAQQRMRGKATVLRDTDLHEDDREDVEEREPEPYPEDNPKFYESELIVPSQRTEQREWGPNEPTLADLRAHLAEAREIGSTPNPPTLSAAAAVVPSHLQETHARSSQSLVARLVGLEDTDRLWDWIRQDADRGAAFLGTPIAHSLALHQIVTTITQGERAGLSRLRSLQYQHEHIGFVLLAPILTREQTALGSFYLRPDLRHSIGRILTPMIEIAMQLAGPMHLAICSTDGWVQFHEQVLKPLGFTRHVMFIR